MDSYLELNRTRRFFPFRKTGAQFVSIHTYKVVLEGLARGGGKGVIRRKVGGVKNTCEVGQNLTNTLKT